MSLHAEEGKSKAVQNFFCYRCELKRLIDSMNKDYVERTSVYK